MHSNRRSFIGSVLGIMAGVAFKIEPATVVPGTVADRLTLLGELFAKGGKGASLVVVEKRVRFVVPVRRVEAQSHLLHWHADDICIGQTIQYEALELAYKGVIIGSRPCKVVAFVGDIVKFDYKLIVS